MDSNKKNQNNSAAALEALLKHLALKPGRCNDLPKIEIDNEEDDDSINHDVNVILKDENEEEDEGNASKVDEGDKTVPDVADVSSIVSLQACKTLKVNVILKDENEEEDEGNASKMDEGDKTVLDVADVSSIVSLQACKTLKGDVQLDENDRRITLNIDNPPKTRTSTDCTDDLIQGGKKSPSKIDTSNKKGTTRSAIPKRVERNITAKIPGVFIMQRKQKFGLKWKFIAGILLIPVVVCAGAFADNPASGTNSADLGGSLNTPGEKEAYTGKGMQRENNCVQYESDFTNSSYFPIENIGMCVTEAAKNIQCQSGHKSVCLLNILRNESFAGCINQYENWLSSSNGCLRITVEKETSKKRVQCYPKSECPGCSDSDSVDLRLSKCLHIVSTTSSCSATIELEFWIKIGTAAFIICKLLKYMKL